MSEIIFIYRGYEVPIQCIRGEIMKTILDKLYTKLNVKKGEVYGLYNGKLLNENIREDEILTNENNKKIILIYDCDKTMINDNMIKKSNEIICPICKEICFIEIRDYKIILYNCKNKHRKENILMNEFDKEQSINLSNIICNICKERNKSNTYNNEFYKCLNCNINICPLCKSKHNDEHNIINYDKKNYICNEHNESYFGYCNECLKNICISCENDHNNHNIISYGKMLKDKNKIIENNNILKKNIDKLNNIIKDIIKKLNNIIENMEKYYEINKNIIDKINNKDRNYELLYNINNINCVDINNNIKNIINEKNINKQFNSIIKLYEKFSIKHNEINNNNDIDEILIQYKINDQDKKDGKIRIFGSKFIENNKNLCKYKYEGKEYELKEYFDLNNYNKDILEIKLINIKNIINMSHLFDECRSLK